MKVVIIEDEKNLATQLQKMLIELEPGVTILKMLESVHESVEFLRSSETPDLMIVDIYLNDGLSFDIFKQVNCPCPVIFCTAYDQYALKAFELDSVDYLLKPIKKDNLQKAISKFKRMYQEGESPENLISLSQSIESLYQKIGAAKSYQKNFLLPYKDRLVPVSVVDVAYFHAENGLVKCVTKDSKLYPMDLSLDALIEKLDPNDFYRANRQFIIKKESIVDVEYYFNGRLYLNIHPKPTESIIISKAKATEFKQWVNEY